ncbi:cysteine proteinase, partial [Rhizopogon vinicolor AM-OR11-026]
PSTSILRYNPSVGGGIEIYGRDLNKLQPKRFLNDTLIEFGLKLWHADIKRRNNDLADEIHIFSPFFYTTLARRKKDNIPWTQILRWTSNFDIFSKEYIIIPMNAK